MTAGPLDIQTSQGNLRDLTACAPAYGPEAQALLARIQAVLPQFNDGFLARFYDGLHGREETQAILARLDSEDVARLHGKQAQHLERLLSPEISAAEHYHHAKRVGRVHEMVGIGLPTLLDAYHRYRQQVQDVVAACALTPAEREFFDRTLMQRVIIDVEGQGVAHHDVGLEVASAISRVHRQVQEAETLPDLLQGVVEALLAVDGIVACFFLRPDARGALQIEGIGGESGRRYVESMRRQEIPFIQIDADSASGQGPTGRAWRSGTIQHCVSYLRDAAVAPWREVGATLGFRSSVAVPLLDDSGQSFAVLTVCSNWPGFFVTGTRGSMLLYLQQVLGHAILRCEQGAVLPVAVRENYRQRLMGGGIEMHYQPIVDLRTGAVSHVEALARLRGADGQIHAPGSFLPALGRSDLLHLFREGLTQACGALRDWERCGPAPAMSINLPADALTQDAYRDALLQTLAREGVRPDRIQLEVLESRDPYDLDRRDASIAALQRLGVRIAQDDLGSGHSSLLRMDNTPFDVVKIDQGLVRNAARDPKRALEFIFHLTRLAHGFGVPVTVEGLEDRGLIEAVAILGADHGQGYVVAKPMTAAEFPAWHAGFRYDVDVHTPRTPLGALAGYLIWDQQRAALAKWPDLVARFTRFPCLVRRYIEESGLRGSELEALLDENHRLAIDGGAPEAFQRTKQELVALLGGAWTRQRASRSAA